MLYDDLNVYVIFKVQDRFVHIVTNEINGPVWEDACAEFFFAPDMAAPLKYFNLETTGGGTPLMCYDIFPLELHYLDTADINEIEIAHTLPELVPIDTTLIPSPGLLNIKYLLHCLKNMPMLPDLLLV